jgi:gas vesicle protein
MRHNLHIYIKGKKGEFNMAEHKNTQGHFFMGCLIGTGLGALAGILFAPKSGIELRSDIKEKGFEVFGEGKDFYSDERKRARKVLKEARHQAKKLKKEADQHLSEAYRQVKEMLAHS